MAESYQIRNQLFLPKTIKKELLLLKNMCKIYRPPLTVQKSLRAVFWHRMIDRRKGKSKISYYLVHDFKSCYKNVE